MTTEHKMTSLADLRRDYCLAGLSESDIDPDPFAQFSKWMGQALAAGILEPTAMTLATVDASGRPAARIVLLKRADSRGFTFFTNYESRKGRDIAVNSRVAMVLHWAGLERQICVNGVASRLPSEDSETYFRARPLASRLAAWSSNQSQIISGRSELEKKMEETKARFPGEEVPLPPHWGGYLVRPESIEFWQGRPSRLHDRLAFFRRPDDGWDLQRLSP